MASRRERYFFYNNLVNVVKGLEGQYTTIDLRNEACLTGKIINVDGYMNVELEDVILYDPRGSELPLDTFFVSSRLILLCSYTKRSGSRSYCRKTITRIDYTKREKG